MPDYTFFTVAGGLFLLVMLGLLARTDWRTMRLPNALTWPLIAGGLLYNFVLSEDFYPYLLGVFLGYGAFWLVEHIYRWVRKRDGLGRGDAKLMAAGGAWCGAVALPFIVFLGSAAALIYVLVLRREDDIKRLPFGPFLAIGIGVVWMGLNVGLALAG